MNFHDMKIQVHYRKVAIPKIYLQKLGFPVDEFFGIQVTESRRGEMAQPEIVPYTQERKDVLEPLMTWLEKEHFDLVVTNNRMPVLGGVEFLERLANKPDPKPPVLFFTGDISEAEKERALKAGARAVLEKPPIFGEIISAVTEALSS